MTLGGQWELAEAPVKLRAHSGRPGQALTWIRVQMPDAIQHALFRAGKVANPWYADNWKQLQWIAQATGICGIAFGFPTLARPPYSAAVRRAQLCGGGVARRSTAGRPRGHVRRAHLRRDGRAASRPRDHEIVVRLIHETDTAHSMKSLAMEGVAVGQQVPHDRPLSTGQAGDSGAAYLEAPYVRTEEIGKRTARLSVQATITHAGAARLEGTVRADRRACDRPRRLGGGGRPGGSPGDMSTGSGRSRFATRSPGGPSVRAISRSTAWN